MTDNTTKPTPGPWHVSSSPDYFKDGATVIRVGEGIVIAVITKTPWCEANARLIASAPELLESLENASHRVRWLMQFVDLESDEEAVLEELRKWDALVERATGAEETAVSDMETFVSDEDLP